MGRGCGGGGLRILPHKSWHVWNRDNVQRVRDDEAKHAEERAVLEAGARKNEAEWRLGVMRSQARRRGRDEVEGDEQEDQEDAGEDAEMPPLERADETADGDEAIAAPDSKRQRIGPAASSTASSSTAEPRVRYVVHQEAATVDPADPSESTSAAPLAGPQHFNLFPDAVGSAKAMEMQRIKKADERAKDLAAHRQYAPVSLFVEALRDRASGEDALRPWYAATEEERQAVEQRKREKKKKVVTRTTGEDGKLRFELNPNGDVRHTTIRDPLEEMKSGLKELKAHEARQGERQAAGLATPSMNRDTSITSPPALEGFRQSSYGAAAVSRSSVTPQLHFSSQVGFTNAPAVSIPDYSGPLFASARALAAEILAHSSSSSSSSDGDTDTSESRSSKKRRREKHRHRSHSRSPSSKKSKKKRHKHSSSEKDRRKKTARSPSRSRSRSRERSRSSSKKEKKAKKERKKSKRSSRAASTHSTSAAPSASTGTPVVPAASHPFSSLPLKSSSELRSEREARERAERKKVADLLGVPVWATRDPGVVVKAPSAFAAAAAGLEPNRSGFGYQR